MTQYYIDLIATLSKRIQELEKVIEEKDKLIFQLEVELL